MIGKLKDQQGSKLTNNASWLIEKIKKQYQLWYNLILCLAILNLNINLIWKILIIIIRKWEKKINPFVYLFISLWVVKKIIY